jgi:hypothetical protein
MSKKTDMDVLPQHWVHSHEEDTETEMVLRPASYKFPPSRGRSSFELKPDGGLVEHGPGPTDRREETEGRWKLEGGERLAFYEASQSKPHRVLHVVSAGRDRLVIQK